MSTYRIGNGFENIKLFIKSAFYSSSALIIMNSNEATQSDIVQPNVKGDRRLQF